MSAYVTGYTRKPKAERTPPVWKMESESLLKDALIDTYLYIKNYDPGYTQSVVSSYRKVFKETATIHVNPGKSVTLLIQEQVVRWNWKADKHFLADETIAVRTVYLTSQNRPAFYFYNIEFDEGGRKRKHMQSPIGNLDIVARLGKFGLDATKAWRAIAEDVLGQSIAIDNVYPGITHFGQKGFQLLGHDVMRCNSAMDATQQIFGKKCYRKDLVRAVGHRMRNISQRNRADILSWTSMFKRLVPVDWLVLSLNRPHPDLDMSEDQYDMVLSPSQVRLFREILSHLKPNERRNILFHTHGTHHGYLLRDTIGQYTHLVRMDGAGIPDVRANIKNLNDLHDLLVTENQRLARERARQYNAKVYDHDKMLINKNDDVERLAFMMELDPRIDIRFARDYDTLHGWSEYMVNCISSYFTSQALLGGIYEDGVLVANFELQYNTGKYALNQLLGKRNQKLDADTKSRIEHIISGYGIHLNSSRWA